MPSGAPARPAAAAPVPHLLAEGQGGCPIWPEPLAGRAATDALHCVRRPVRGDPPPSDAGRAG
eukprot:11866835-Alexandrium_andersonii.AAC.1